MHKAIQAILLVVGVFLIGYGLYSMITPEASIDLGIVEAEIQDNNNAYVNMGFGLASNNFKFACQQKKIIYNWIINLKLDDYCCQAFLVLIVVKVLSLHT